MGEHHWWSNVYNDNCWDGPNGVAYVLDKSHPTREAADRFCSIDRIGCVHVRLKPEGAPRRYASELDRWLWEAGARSLARLIAPRTPKFEESAS